MHPCSNLDSFIPRNGCCSGLVPFTRSQLSSDKLCVPAHFILYLARSGSIDEAHFLSPSRFKKQGLIFSLQGKWSFLGPERTFGVGHWNDWANLTTLCALIMKGLILAVIEPLLSLASTFGFRRHWEFFFLYNTASSSLTVWYLYEDAHKSPSRDE